MRARLEAGPLPARKAIDYALQTARGLAAAHEKGIVHRDLKPENLFITTDGRIKILDFGLAKLIRREPDSAATDTDATRAAETEPGVVLGTAGYMSPEQVRGVPADARADLFSFGAILYEMLSGRRAFPAETAVQAMTAILQQDPPPLPVEQPPALRRIVERCLEKGPPERFQSAADLAFALAFALESPSGLSGLSPVPAVARLRPRWVLTAVLAGVFLLGGLGIGGVIGRRLATRTPPLFHQLTFRRGTIQSAKLAPDGETIVYGASWDGHPVELFSTRRGGSESRALDIKNADILSISPAGEMAILLHPRTLAPLLEIGTLARVPLAGGAPREVLEDVEDADWSPDGKDLIVARYAGQHSRIEFPIGKVLYESAAHYKHVRLSPKGDRIAFFERPIGLASGWTLVVVDLTGRKTRYSDWFTFWGLAWSPGGEIWFTASQQGTQAALYAVTPGGRERLVERIPDPLSLRDISRDGQVLLIRQSFRMSVIGLAPGQTRERDFSWLNNSFATDVSAGGKTLVLVDIDPASTERFSVYLRKTDGSAAVRLGEAHSPLAALSPDEKWVAVIRQKPALAIVLLPTRAGVPQTLANDQIASYYSVSWFADGKRILFTGADRTGVPRLYAWDLAAGKAVPIAPEAAGVVGCCVSPDGQWVAAVAANQEVRLYPVNGGAGRPVRGASPGDLPIRWSPDSRALYATRADELPKKVYRVDLAGGRRELWKELTLADSAAVVPGYSWLALTPDAKSYFHSFGRLFSELYLVEGLR